METSSQKLIVPEAINQRIAQHFLFSRWLHGYVKSKLRTDPVYNATYEQLHSSPYPMLDIGCGVGLLPFYMRERGVSNEIRGIDLDEKKIAIAQSIALTHYPGIHFAVQDATQISHFSGNVLMLDLLHYLSTQEQLNLLSTLIPMIPPGGKVIIRDCIKNDSWRFRITLLQEKFSRAIRWLRGRELNFPTADFICLPFRQHGFSEQVTPLWGNTPFNNHLFIFQRPE